MVKGTMEIKTKSVILYNEGIHTAKEIGIMYGLSDRTIRRWSSSYDKGGYESLTPKKTGPKTSRNRMKKSIEQRLIRLKGVYPSWGARRIKHQFNIPVSWRTIHRFFKKHGLLVHIKAKPQPCKRFQRKHVDSMWQGDTFQFRIRDVGKVYVTGFTDDCSRYRVVSKTYLTKGKEASVNALYWALRKGRIPREIYLDNGKQFIAKVFKQEAAKYGIKLIYGRPYHPRGRGKIEGYHKILYRELICLREFRSLSHFRKELWKFDRRYNNWRKQEVLGWQTPALIYNNRKYFNKGKHHVKKRT
jgi:transposase InsO family protein